MLIYRHLAIMVYSEKLLNIIALVKCDNHHTKKANIGFALWVHTTKYRQSLAPPFVGRALVNIIRWMTSSVNHACSLFCSIKTDQPMTVTIIGIFNLKLFYY